MLTFQCNINGEQCFKSAKSVESLKKRIRQTLKKKYGFWDDDKISIQVVRNPHCHPDPPKGGEGSEILRSAQNDRGNLITEQLRHL